MTDLRLSRLIAQHERDAVCKTCGGGENMMIHAPEWAEGRAPGHSGHVYVPSFNVAEYVRGVAAGQSVEAREQQPPLC